MFLNLFSNDVASWIGRIIVLIFIGSIAYSLISSQQIREEYQNNLDIMLELSKTNKDVHDCWLRFMNWKMGNPNWTWDEGNTQVKYCISLKYKN